MSLMLEDVWQYPLMIGGRVAMPLMLEDMWQCL